MQRTPVSGSLRKGGPAEAGSLYKVHKDEYIVPSQNSTVVSQVMSREFDRQVAAVNTRPPVAGDFKHFRTPGMSAAPAADYQGGMLSEMKGLRGDIKGLSKLIQSRPMKVDSPMSVTLVNERNPARRSLEMMLAHQKMQTSIARI
jgi:hypothetical protein